MATMKRVPWRRATLKKVLGALKSWFAPIPKQKIWEWAKEHRVFASGVTSHPGRYDPQRLPYQVEPQEAATDPRVGEIVLLWGSQLGKTEVLNHIVGFFTAVWPSPILVVYPDIPKALDWMRKKFKPMVEQCAPLTAIFGDMKSRVAGQTKLNREFPGGFIKVASANSPASLRGDSCRIVLQDEIDSYCADNGEGDPGAMADRRCANFGDALKIKSSTPTFKGLSRIDREFQDSDQRYWHAKCPHCSTEQILIWENVVFEKEKPEQARYRCSNHRACPQPMWTDHDRIKAIYDGRWIALQPWHPRRGYHLSGLYRLLGLQKPFESFLHMFVVDYLKARAGGETTYREWVQQFLALAYELEGEVVSADPLYQRREAYDPARELPVGVCYIAGGVDTQDDRLEYVIAGFGAGEEMWLLETGTIHGDTSQENGEVWKALDERLSQKWQHPAGYSVGIKAALIDSGGHRKKAVYAFTKNKKSRGIFASKGSSRDDVPVVSRPRPQGSSGVGLILVGTIALKDSLYARLRMEKPGAGYIHFPSTSEFDTEFFKQLTGEKVITVRRGGVDVRRYVKIPGVRNEALDMVVLSMAAAAHLGYSPGKVEAMAKRLREEAEKRAAENKKPTEDKKPAEQKPQAEKKPEAPEKKDADDPWAGIRKPKAPTTKPAAPQTGKSWTNPFGRQRVGGWVGGWR